MIEWFARNHVAANLLMVFILFLGLISLTTRISLEIFPAVELDMISVSMSIRGATPEDVEQGAAIRIEEAIQDLEGIKQVSSRSIEGATTVNIEVDSDYNARDLLDEVKNRIGAINTFPVEAEKPLINLAQRKREVLTVTIAGDFSEKELREYAEQVRDDLLGLDNVTQVELDGVRSYEVAIEVSPDRLRQYQLTLAEVANAIQSSSLDQSAGNVHTKGGDILLRAKGQSYHRDDFSRIVVKSSVDGSVIRLSDIAIIRDEFEETSLRTRFNGQRAVLIQVYRVGKQSAIAVANDVKQYIRDQQTKLPTGMSLSYWDDDSQIVKNRLTTLTNNAIQGGIMVFALLTLFLRPSIAFWVFIGIPISFMGAFTFMPFLDITLNIVSLFGFILVLGIVVDDAIVTGENVYRHMRATESGLQAAISGTREVAIPVTFGVLTTVAAFLPIGFIEGVRGAIFAQIPAVVIPVLIFSLIESKFVLPAHLRYIDLNKQPRMLKGFTAWQQRFADGFEAFILKYYQPLLAVCLKNRLTTLSGFIGILIILYAIVSSGWMHFVFFPRIQSETARATLTMPAGTSFDVTDRVIEKMTDAARRLQEKYRDPETSQSVIMNILASSGSGSRGSNGSHVGRVMFELVPPERRLIKISSADLVNEWRKLIGPVPGAETLTFRAEIGRGGDPIDVQLRSNSLASLEDVASKVRARLATYPTVFDIADTLSDGKQQLQIELNEQGYALGLTRANVIRQVRNAFYGAEVQRIQRGRDDVRVFVRYPEDERNSVSHLEELLIRTPDNRSIPLANIATLIPGKSAATIYRIDYFRTANITADIDKTATNMIVLQEDLTKYLDELMTHYRGVSYQLEGEAREQRESFGSLGLGLIFVLFTIYSLLAIPLKSFTQPLIVMSVIPFGAIGAIVGHWIMAIDLSLMSLLGLMALIGVVVNDSLVLVDFINSTRRNNGDNSLFEAVISAGAARFRPVMLTSLTTFFGLMPLLFEKSTQAQFLIPMAVSLGFGIMFATFITLLLVPVNYMLTEDIARLFGRTKTTSASQTSA